MIAILCGEERRPVVREFFELFKTPWEFYRGGHQYEVLICCDTQPPENSAKLVLIYGTEQRPFDQEQGFAIGSQSSSRVLSYKGDRIPIYGGCITFHGPRNQTLIDESTGQPAFLEKCSTSQKLVRIGFDLFGEIHHLLTAGQPPAYAGLPALEMHIALLRDLIVGCSICLVEIPPIPHGHSFIACLTHDVDHFGVRNHKCDRTMFGFLYRSTVGSLINVCMGKRSIKYLKTNWTAAVSLPFVHLGIAKDFWCQFDRYVAIEEGLASTFFVIPYKNDPGQDTSGRRPAMRATQYDVTDIVDYLHQLLAAGHEIGLHGIDAWRDSAKGAKELERISGLTQVGDIGVRMHWLFFDKTSFATLEKAGFSYDSTVGYNEAVGYRAGTTQAFKPLEVARMLELPMHLMDTALFYPAYMNLSPRQAGTVVASLMDNAARFGGVLTVNWHDRSIAPERLWDEFYVKLLDDLKIRGAWFPTAAQAVSWFRKRRSAVVDAVAREGDELVVKASLNKPDDDSLPALRVRIHNPNGGQNDGSLRRGLEGGFVDIPLNHHGEMRVPL
jgi:peptidoglycan/xylan/chitin deacetylase (PgdA/CDA1 family)